MKTTPTIQCPTDDVLRSYASGSLPPRDHDGIAVHLEKCRPCQERLERHEASAVTAAQGAASKEETTPSLLASGGITLDAARPTPVARVATGAIPGYELLDELGRGGMGVVYRARQTKLNRIVALKMILAGAHASADDLARFRLEAEAVARLQHANIVQIHEVGEHQGLPYFSLEFVGGGNLDKKLQGRPLVPEAASRLTALLAHAVHAAHERGILHRDLKPGNVFLMPTKDSSGIPIEDRDGKAARFVPKIGDFGLAKAIEAGEPASVRAQPERQRGSQDDGFATPLTAAGAIVGTPSYMAPEQAAGLTEELGLAVDVYALGAILYELLTGRPPYRAANMLDTLKQVVNEEPVPPGRLNAKVPRDLETICLKCLRKEPAKRYGSAQQLAEDLERFVRGEPIQARPVRRVERVVKWCRRRPALAALAALAVLLLSAAAVAAVSMRRLAEADTHRRQQHDDMIAELRQAAELDERLALSEVQAGRFKGARDQADKAASRLEDVPELIRVRDRLQAMRDRMEQLVVFYRHMDGAERNAARMTQDAGAMEAAKAALDSLDVLKQAEWWEHLPDQDLTAPQRGRLRDDVYEVILLLAGLQAKEGGQHVFSEDGDAGFRLARSTVQAAARLRFSQGVYAVEAVCRLGLRELPVAGSVPDPGPVTAVDYYFNGIVHLAIAMQSDRLVELAVPLIRTVKMEGLDLKTPMATAQERLTIAARLDPKHFWTHFWLGDVLKTAGKLQEAELAFNTCIALRPDYGAGYSGRGVVLADLAINSQNPTVRKQLVTRALADLDQGVLLESEAFEAFAHNYRANVLFKFLDTIADSDSRDTWLRQVIDDRTAEIRFNSKHPAHFGNRGVCHYFLKEYDLAIADLTEGIRCDPQQPEREVQELLQDRGQVHLAKGDYANAIADFTQAAKLAPNNELLAATLERAKKGSAAALPAVKLDSDSLLIVSRRTGAHEIFLVNAAGSKATNLTQSPSGNAYPVWSPDGSEIAFTSNRTGTWQIFVMNADGSKVRQLTTGTQGCSMPSWSADGKKLAFSRTVGSGPPHICVIDDDARSRVTDVGAGSDPALAPDGRKILFARSSGGAFKLCLMDADGRNIKELPRTAAVWVGDPCWSPDASRIAWSQRVGAAVELFTADATGENVRQLTDLGGFNYCPAWSPDGTRIAFVSFADAISGGGQHCVIDINGANSGTWLDERTAMDGRPSWRPSDSSPYYHLSRGVALEDRKKVDEAEAEYRKAIGLLPKLAEPHRNLGVLLIKKNKFEEALLVLQAGAELLAENDARRPLFLQLIDDCQGYIKFDGRLGPVLEGSDKPATAAEQVQFAKLCRVKALYAAAAQFYRDAFTADAGLAENGSTNARYDAACCAALASAGQGKDANKLDGKERAEWRQQARDWLRADLTWWSKFLSDDPRKAADSVQQTLKHWQADDDLAAIREKDILAKLSLEERTKSQQLWNDVTALLGRTQETLVEATSLQGHELRVTSVTYGVDSDHVLAGGDDTTFRGWDTKSKKELFQRKSHSGYVLGIARAPDGKLSATASHDHTVKIWNSDTGEEIRTLNGHGDVVSTVAFSPDGKQLASGSNDKTIRIWEVATGDLLRTLPFPNEVRSLAYVDGTRLAVVGAKHAGILDANSGKELVTLNGGGTFSDVAVRPDGKHVAASSDDLSVTIWNAENGTRLFTLKGHGGRVTSVAYSPDGKYLASGSDDRTVRIWDATKGTEILAAQVHADVVRSVAFSPDGKMIASASHDRTVKVWSIDEALAAKKGLKGSP